jgi:hypothetical protein
MIAEALRQQPRHDVDAAASRDRDDDVHRPVGIVRARRRGQATGHDGDQQAVERRRPELCFNHGNPPPPQDASEAVVAAGP